MAINLLIDTSNVIRLLNVLEEDRNLHKLSVWLDLQEIRLYVPDILLREWEEHKVKKLNEIGEIVKKIVNKHKVNKAFPTVQNNPPEVEIGHLRIKSQIALIDRWVQASVQFSEGPQSAAARQQQQTEQLPPFQGGKDSVKDATILFSTMEKLAEKNPVTLFFVSANTRDFSTVENGKRILHPAIQARFPSVTVEYFETLNQFVDYAVTNNVLTRRPETISANDRLLRNFVISPDIHPIDQLYGYLTARFRIIKFLPRSLYVPHYPIAVATARDSFDRPFTISTNNKDILDFLRSVKVSDGQIDTSHLPGIDQVENAAEKIRTILETLNFNFGHQIAKGIENPVPIAVIEKDLSGTLTSKYQQLKFDGLWAKITVTFDETVDSLMEKGYLHYKLGNYVEAARIYQQARSRAEKDNNYDQTFFSIFSLSKLAAFATSSVFQQPELHSLRDDLQAINLPGAVTAYSTDANRDILSWLADNRFISEGIAELSSIASEIDKLQHQKSSGWNSHFFEVLNTYFEIENFLLYNHIVFDKFPDFQNLTDFFLRGLFASYASNQRIGNQIEVFPEWLLETLMINGKAESIRHYFSRYRLEAIQYRSERFDYFETILLPFLRGFTTTLSDSNGQDSETAENFRDHLAKLLGNAIVLIAITDIRDDLQANLLTSLHEILSNWDGTLRPSTFDHFNFLFVRKHKKFRPQIAKQLLITLLEKKIQIKDLLYTNLTRILAAHNQTLFLTDEQFNRFTADWLVLRQNDLDYAETIFEIHDLLERPEQKARISAFVNDTLNTHFNHRLFYLADFSKLINPTDEQVAKFETYLIARLTPPPPDAIVKPIPLQFPKAAPVDQYIHYCVQHHHLIPPDLKVTILNLDPYYKWLFDPEHFDYAHFLPVWLRHDLSIALKKTLSSSDALKTHLITYLKHKKNDEALSAFFELFHN